MRDMIHNPYYVGKIYYRGMRASKTGNSRRSTQPEIYDGKHEAIIPQDLWDRCQEVSRQRSRISHVDRPTKRIFLVNGIIHCYHCGRRLRVQTVAKTKKIYYREVSSLVGGECTNDKKGVHADEIDQQIAEFLTGLQLPTDWKSIVDEDNQNIDKKLLNDEISRVKIEQKRTLALLEFASTDDILEIQSKARSFKKQVDQLESQAKQEYDYPANELTKISQTWHTADRASQRKLVRSVIEKVCCDVDKSQIVWIEPHAEFKPLFSLFWPEFVDDSGKCWLVDDLHTGVLIKNEGK